MATQTKPEIASTSASGRALTCYVHTCDLQLGMHVQIDAAPYMWATVESIGPATITLVRPYVHAPGPSYCGGADLSRNGAAAKGDHQITTYVGIERFDLSRESNEPRIVSCETHPYFSRWVSP